MATPPIHKDRFDAAGPVLLVAPVPPPYGGMALQAQQLAKFLRMDGNTVLFFQSNLAFPNWLQWLDRLPGLRTLVRSTLIWITLWSKVRQAKIVHVFAASWVYFFTVVCPAVIVARALGKRVVLNYRGGEAEKFFGLWGWLARPIFKMAQVVTAPSGFLAGVIQSEFQVPVPIVPNILNLSAFKYRERARFAPKMLVTRHLEEIYDIESVLKAFRSVQEGHPEASLIIAGTGNQEGHLRSLASSWNLKNVDFLGRVEHQHLPSVYDQCDILLNASTVDNFPAALVEASAAGLAVVSTSPGGIPFIYQNRKNALLVDVGDWQGLARSVEALLEDPALGPELTKAALATVQAFDWSEVRKCLYRVYDAEPIDEPSETSRRSISNARPVEDEKRTGASGVHRSAIRAVGN